jgi:hypothetical protein
MNDPIPYHIRDVDIDEVLNTYAAPDEVRAAAHQLVMQRVLDINELVRMAPETAHDQRLIHRDTLGSGNEHPGDQAPERRELALAAIEDILITAGFVEPDSPENRLYPIVRDREQ